MNAPQEVTAFILSPQNWAYGVIALVLLFLLFGRQDRYDEIDKVIADRHGVNLPEGGTKGIGPVDALNIVAFLGLPAALMAGFMLDPVFYGLAAVLFVVLVITLLRVWSTSQARLRRAGVASNDSAAAAGGFILTLVLIAVFVTAAVLAFMGLLV